MNLKSVHFQMGPRDGQGSQAQILHHEACDVLREEVPQHHLYLFEAFYDTHQIILVSKYETITKPNGGREREGQKISAYCSVKG